MQSRDAETGEPGPRYHVLLIGIDAYDGGALLNGCVNDIDAIQELLLTRLKITADRITRLAAPLDGRTSAIPQDKPTYANIKAALEALASERVQPGDRVLIYYSGHGTQVKTKMPSGEVFTREALMPTDFIVRLKGRRYVYDWEFNDVLARIARRTSSVAVVLDACFGGGATRDAFDPPDGKARFWPTEEEVELPADVSPPPRGSLRGMADAIPGTVSSCVVAAACLDDERAREGVRPGGQMHGELTRALLRQFAAIPDDRELAELRWGRIWRSVVADVATVSPAQHPWHSGGFARQVFAGPPADGDVGYAVRTEGDGFRIDAGTLCGVTEGATIAVRGPIGGDQAVIGQLRVTHAGRASATAVALAPFELPQGAHGRMIAAGAAARLSVAVVPRDAAMIARIESPMIEVADDPATADVTLAQRGDRSWAVTDEVFGAGEEAGEPALVIIPESSEGRARAVLEHYFTYSLPLRMAKACTDLPRALRMKLLDCTGAGPIAPADAQDPAKLPPEVVPTREGTYDVKAGDAAGGGTHVAVLVQNTSAVDLSVWLVVCQTNGAVAVIPPVRIRAGGVRVFWEGDELGRGFEIWFSDERRVGVERLVVIGTTDKEASLFHLGTETKFKDVLASERGEEETKDLPAAELPLWTATTVSLRSSR